MDSAFYWFKQAAEQGHEKAIVETAQAYRDGEGVEKNEDIAFGILKDYSDRGYSKCSQELAHHYYQSPSSSHFNLRLAEQTYIRIIQRGEPEAFADAVNRLGYIYGGSYIFGNPTDEYSDRRKAAYCLALAHFTDPDLYDTDDLIKVGYRWTENEMRKWLEDAQNLRYNPV